MGEPVRIGTGITDASAGPYDGPADALDPPGELVNCDSSFLVTNDCHHPTVSTDCTNGWCVIPKGCFVMGSPDCEFGRGAYDEDEVQVTLTHDFEIAAHETTQGEWQSAGFANPSRFDAGDCIAPTCPVGNVTWFDAIAYANRLSQLHSPPFDPCYRLNSCVGTPGDGLVCASVETTATTLYECDGYRLPTEAEWEYAARAGTRAAVYSGPLTSHRFNVCSHDSNLEAVAWYCENAGSHTHPAQGRAPNAWGLYDMLGNSYEWVSDVFDGLGYGKVPLVDPGSVVGSGSERAIRGGLFANASEACRAASRGEFGWNERGGAQGFRLARSLRTRLNDH